MPVIGLELGTSRSAGEHLNHYTTEYTRKSRLKNTIHKCRFIDFNEFSNMEWKLRCFGENEMWNYENALCLHYLDNISCNNSSASQHWVSLWKVQPLYINDNGVLTVNQIEGLRATTNLLSMFRQTILQSVKWW